MRRVNIQTGLKQRINDILGQNDTNDGSVTPWSIQAAMLSNTQRIAQGIVGEALYGRVMKGLKISYLSSTPASVSISSGYGFTPDGYIISVATPITLDISQYISGNIYIYLKYSLVAATESVHDYGKNTAFNSTNITEEIVFDESGLVSGTSITSDIIDVGITTPISRNGYVYLGSVNVDSFSSTSLITNTYDVGIQSLIDSSTGYYQDISDGVSISLIGETGDISINHAFVSKLNKTINLDISFDVTSISNHGSSLSKIIVSLPDSCKCANRYAVSPSGNYFFNVLNDTLENNTLVMSVCGFFYATGANQYKTFNIVRSASNNTTLIPFLVGATGTNDARFTINISYEEALS